MYISDTTKDTMSKISASVYIVQLIAWGTGIAKYLNCLFRNWVEWIMVGNAPRYLRKKYWMIYFFLSYTQLLYFFVFCEAQTVLKKGIFDPMEECSMKCRFKINRLRCVIRFHDQFLTLFRGCVMTKAVTKLQKREKRKMVWRILCGRANLRSHFTLSSNQSLSFTT